MEEGIGNSEGLAELPAAYRKWRASTLGRITDALERELILDQIGPASGWHVLDVGCGDGEFALELWKRGAKVTGIDASPAMIGAARARAAQHGADIAFEVGTAQSLPFRSNAFDRVVAITVLCFVKDAASVLREMAWVLRPGGLVVIGELGKWSTWAAGRRFRGWLGSSLWGQAHFRTERELRALAREAGLVVNSSMGAIYYPHCGVAARLLGPFDHKFSRLTTVGAAFLALSATKSSG